MKFCFSRAWTVAALAVFGLALPVIAWAQTQEVQKEAEEKLQAARQRLVAPQPAPAAQPAVKPASGKGITFLEKAFDDARPRDPRTDAKLLAQRIDQIMEARLANLGVQAAPPASDAQNLRRLTLDLIGRIPNLLEMRDYIDKDDPAKREEEIERLLNSPDYAKHFSYLFRALMLPTTDNVQVQQLQPSFENWLRTRLKDNIGYDKLVQELLMTQPQNGNFFNGQASPGAFFLASELKPENLAGSTSRIFLGVKLECAQCHSHPFASWTKNQFWEYAAFFSGFQRQQVQQLGRGGGQPFNPLSKEILIPGTEKKVKAKFLNGQEPKWQEGVATMTTLTDWMMESDNPYFARAAVDHVWQMFFGVSLLEPIIEPQGDDMITYPELLDELARQFVAHKYDLKFLVRTIVQTKAYQRSSTGPMQGKDDYQIYARMPVRGMTPEQLFDSVAEATDYQEPAGNPQQQFNQFNGPQTPRRAFLAKFASQDKRIETNTSILQALFMMNGQFLADRVKLENNKSLQTIATSKISTARRVETLYLLVLSRPPRPEESQRFVRYIDSGGATGDQAQAVADVYWVLLNSSEFLLNH